MSDPVEAAIMRGDAAMSGLFPEPVTVAAEPETYPWALDRAIDVFLHRWSFNWRAERGVIEQELRALIAEAKARG